MKLLHAALGGLAILGAVACSAEAPEAGATDTAPLTASDAPLARFMPHLQALRGALEKPTTTEAAADLVRSGRPAAFNLQAVSRLYVSAHQHDPQFDAMKSDFKGLEDGIGQYAKWSDIYEAAVAQHAPEATIASTKAKRDSALATFQSSLESQRWRAPAGGPSPRLTEIETFLKNFAWPEAKTDRAALISALTKELGELQSTQYDMTILEHGDGLHELRRDLRWLLLEMTNLHGMIVFKSQNDCPVAAYANASPSRFSLTPSNVESSPCQISRCLFGEADQLVSSLGGLKDQAETRNNIAGDSDVVPADLQPDANKLYKEMVDGKLADALTTELESCKRAL